MNGPVRARRAHAADAVHEGKAVIGEQIADLAEIGVEMADADMLHHANRNHPVEAAFQRAIVEFAELDQTLDAGGRGVLARDTELLGRDVDRGHPRPGCGGDVDGEGAPAGADLGHRHAGRRPQLGCRTLQLLQLRLFQCIGGRVFEDRAGIVQAVVEEQPIELGRDVVMVAGVGRRDRRGIRLVPAPRGAPQPSQQRLTGMRREAAAIDREQLHEAADIRAVLECECAVHVGFAGVQLGVQEQLGVKPGIVQADGDGRPGAVTAEFVQRTVGGDQPQLRRFE